MSLMRQNKNTQHTSAVFEQPILRPNGAGVSRFSECPKSRTKTFFTQFRLTRLELYIYSFDFIQNKMLISNVLRGESIFFNEKISLENIDLVGLKYKTELETEPQDYKNILVVVVVSDRIIQILLFGLECC